MASKCHERQKEAMASKASWLSAKSFYSQDWTASYSSLISENLSSLRLGRPTGFHNLPTRILIEIFKHSNRVDLQNSISLVCRQWHHAALSPELWTTFQIIRKEAPITFICQRIGQFRRLESIYLKNIEDVTKVVRQICRCCPKLKNLTLRQCNEIPERSLRNIICSCKVLESLDLSGTSFKGHTFYEETSGLKNLKCLNLSKNQYLEPKNLIAVALNCRNLEEFRMSRFLQTSHQLSDNDALIIFSNLNKKLRCLSLDTARLSNFGFQCILRCNKLEYLALYGTEYFSAELFVNMYKYLPNLKKIKIHQAYLIGGNHVEKLFTQGSPSLKRVFSIDLTGCWKVTDEGIAAVAVCCNNLKSLILKACKSLRDLSAVTKHCEHLEFLNVAYCPHLNETSLVELPKSLKVFVIHGIHKYRKLADFMLANRRNLKIKIALSEYNKEMEDYN